MKILQVCPRFSPYIGGVETHVRRLSLELHDMGHEVEVLTTVPPGVQLEDNEHGISVTRVTGLNPSDAYYFAPQLFRLVKRSKAEIIHVHSFHAFPALFASIAIQSQILIVTPHYHGKGHTAFRRILFSAYKPIGKIILRKARSIICVSGYESGLVRRDFWDFKSKIRIIPNGIDLEEMRRIRKRAAIPPRILTVGRLERYKGIQHLIRGISQIRSKDEVFLDVVGDGPYRKQLQKIAREESIVDRIRWFKNIPRFDLLKLFSRASVFVSLSQGEAFGIAVAEALAAGVPCLVASNSALEDFVDNKLCFSLSTPFSPERIAESILSIIRTEVAQVATYKYRLLKNWREVAEMTVSVYREAFLMKRKKTKSI